MAKMSPKVKALLALKKFLNQSEANRLKPAPEARAPEAPAEEMSPEANEALLSLAKEG